MRDLATFHIYFDLSHIPAQVPRQDSLLHKVIIIFIIQMIKFFITILETKLPAARGAD